MTRRRKRQSGAGVRLPWEGRHAWISDALTGRRFRPLLAMLTVVGLLVGAWNLAEEQRRLRTTHAGIDDVHRAIASFRAELGRCPKSTVELVHPPKAGAQYLEELPADGWGRPLMVRCPGRHNPTGADVISAGPSGSFAMDDNVL